jgi:hypothetical protein
MTQWFVVMVVSS